MPEKPKRPRSPFKVGDVVRRKSDRIHALTGGTVKEIEYQTIPRSDGSTVSYWAVLFEGAFAWCAADNYER